MRLHSTDLAAKTRRFCSLLEQNSRSGYGERKREASREFTRHPQQVQACKSLPIDAIRIPPIRRDNSEFDPSASICRVGGNHLCTLRGSASTRRSMKPDGVRKYGTWPNVEGASRPEGRKRDAVIAGALFLMWRDLARKTPECRGKQHGSQSQLLSSDIGTIADFNH